MDGGWVGRERCEDDCQTPAIVYCTILAASGFIQRHWQGRMQAQITPPRDAKTRLQEWALGRGLPLPSYRMVSQEGPAHEPEITVE